ncbi:MAG: type VII toxin-antitoxin system MntA family adenylyltransferase antitoxin [Promethearchaeota archaeon]
MVNLEKIKEIACKYKLILIYLFGSKAIQKTSKLSDIDIAILLNDKIHYDLKELILDLIFEFVQIFRIDRIDLLILNSAPLAIQYNVITEGKLLYQSNIEERCNYEIKIRKKYFDFKKYEEEYFKAMHDQILEEY